MLIKCDCIWPTFLHSILNVQLLLYKYSVSMHFKVSFRKGSIHTFSVHSSKKAKLASMSDTNDLSSMNLMNIWVFIIELKNLLWVLSRDRTNPVTNPGNTTRSLENVRQTQEENNQSRKPCTISKKHFTLNDIVLLAISDLTYLIILFSMHNTWVIVICGIILSWTSKF